MKAATPACWWSISRASWPAWWRGVSRSSPTRPGWYREPRRWTYRSSGWSRTRTSSAPQCPSCSRCRRAPLCWPNTASAPWGSRRSPMPWPEPGSATGWCAALRPISASTRACWGSWRAAPGSLWWWMLCHPALPPTGSSPSVSWRPGARPSPRWRCASTS